MVLAVLMKAFSMRSAFCRRTCIFSIMARLASMFDDTSAATLATVAVAGPGAGALAAKAGRTSLKSALKRTPARPKPRKVSICACDLILK